MKAPVQPPWTDTGSTADQQKALTLANGIIQQALSNGMRVDVVMMAGSLSTKRTPPDELEHAYWRSVTRRPDDSVLDLLS